MVKSTTILMAVMVITFVAPASAQTVSVSRLTPGLTCAEMLRVVPEAARLTDEQLRTELGAANEQLRTLTSQSPAEARLVLLNQMYRLYLGSDGNIQLWYGLARSARRLGEWRLARQAFVCLRENPAFTRLPAPVRTATNDSITELEPLIAAQSPVTPPGPTPSVVPGPVVVATPLVVRTSPIVTPPAAVSRTPHPRSPTLRLVGQIGVGTAIALAVTGGILEGLCLSLVSDIDAYNALPGPRPRSEQAAQEEIVASGQTLCTVAPILLGTGAALGLGAVLLWQHGGTLVTDEPLPPAPRIAFGLRPTGSGLGANLTLRFF